MADQNPLPPNTYARTDAGLGAPVDRSQERYAPSPYAPQKILPHGDVSRDGERVWPRPSATSRVLVYGGAGIAAAAVTAGAVLAVRKVADMVSGNDDVDRDADRAAKKARERVYDVASGRHAPKTAPKFALMSERERDAMRARARARLREDERERSRARAEAVAARRDDEDAPHPVPRPRRPDEDRPRKRRAPRPNASPLGFLGDVEQSTERLAQNINGIVAAVGAALTAFRQVSGQAQSVMREFGDTADQVRSFLGTETRGRDADGFVRRATPRRDDEFRRTRRSDVVDLRDNADDAAESTRTHRL